MVLTTDPVPTAMQVVAEGQETAVRTSPLASPSAAHLLPPLVVALPTLGPKTPAPTATQCDGVAHDTLPAPSALGGIDPCVQVVPPSVEVMEVS